MRKLATAILLVVYLLLSVQPVRYRALAPHMSGLAEIVVPSAYAQDESGLPDCDGTEAKPDAWCPDQMWGPCTEYICKFTGNMKRRCKFDRWPLSDKKCPGCRNDKTIECREKKQDGFLE